MAIKINRQRPDRKPKGTTCLGIAACGKTSNLTTINNTITQLKKKMGINLLIQLFLWQTLLKNPVPTPKWVLDAGKKDWEKVLSKKGFGRFSVTTNLQVYELYNGYTQTHPTRTDIRKIRRAVKDHKKDLKACLRYPPTIDYFQWTDYLERTEVWKPGPVFVFQNDQLTHIWLDTAK